MAQEIDIDLKLAVKDALKGLKVLEAQGKKANSTFDTLGKTLVYLNQGVALVGRAFGFVNRSVSEAIRLSAEQERVEKLLAESLIQKGVYTKEVYRANLDLASSLQQLTTFGDEQILQVQRSLIQFGIEQEQLKGVTAATLDLAAAKGMDLNAAAELVAKSVGSSTNALARYGIEVKGAAGSTERAKAAVEGIGKIYGGSAQAEVKTYAGATKQLSNTWGDFLEKIGNVITRSPASVDAINAVNNAILKLQGYADKIPQAFEYINDAIVSVNDAFYDLSDFLILNSDYLEYLGVALGAATIAFGAYQVAVNFGTITTVAYSVALKASTLATTLMTTATTAFTAVMALVTSPVTLVVGAIALLTTGVYALYKNWTLVTGYIKVFVANILDFLMPALDVYLSSMQSIVGIFNKEWAASIQKQKDNLKSLTATLREEGQKQIDAQTEKNENERTLLEEDLTLKSEIRQANREIEMEQDQRQVENKIELDQRRTESNKTAANEENKIQEQQKKNYASWGEAYRGEVLKIEEYEKLTNKRRVQNFQDTVGYIASAQSSGIGVLAALGKAAAIYQATIDGYVAVQKALASGIPYPFNLAAAAAVGAITAANVAKIAGVNFQDGGIVPGSSFSGDNVQANVNSGEMILNRQQQAELFQLAQGGGSSGASIVVNISGDVVSEDGFIDRVVAGINEGVENRNLQLRA